MTPAAAFELPIATRGYETDQTRTVPVVRFMSYLEHLRWESMQVEELGLIDHLHLGHFFVVRSQTIEVVKTVGLSVDLLARAVLERVGRCSAFVRHEVVRVDDGSLVTHGRVNGVWLGPDRALARIPPAMREYGKRQQAALDALIAPERMPEHQHSSVREGALSERSLLAPPIALHRSRGLDAPFLERADAPVYAHPLTVRPSDLDVFNHVNAARYAAFCEDARRLGGLESAWAHVRDIAQRPATRIAIEYRREAVLGDQLDVITWPGDDSSFGFELRRRGETDPLCLARIDVADVP